MKTFLKIYISLCLILSPIFFINSANAAGFDGWTLSDLAPSGADTTARGTKPVTIDGKDYIKRGKAKITPTAAQVSKVLKGGVAGAALSLAVEQMLGVVDWVLDAANNQIKYKQPATDPISPQNQYYYQWRGIKYSTMAPLCIAIFKAQGWAGPITTSLPAGYGCSLVGSIVSPYGPPGSFGDVGAYRVANPAYDPNADEQEKTLPLDAVAQQVISNAEANDANAQVATTAAAQDIINDAQQDEAKARPIVQQLEASASTENADAAAQQAANQAQGQSKPNSVNPNATDIALEFPTFCGWAPLVCEAAQVAISFPNTLTNWWTTATTAISSSWTLFTEWLDWTKQDTDLPDTENVQISELPTPEITENYISWGASCPADVQIPISLQGASSTLTFSWSPWCQLLSIIRPAIVASAYIGAAFIVLGLRT
jgi:hypothetical protein